MSSDIVVVAQLISIVVAACGTPGLTFWVMKRMNQNFTVQIKESCKACRAHLDEKLEGHDGRIKEAEERQRKLREKLPIDYVRRPEFERHLNEEAKRAG
ncbi:MAG: hypothetical protein AB1491_01825 [Thermodesulfobacteriota bacterium]